MHITENCPGYCMLACQFSPRPARVGWLDPKPKCACLTCLLKMNVHILCRLDCCSPTSHTGGGTVHTCVFLCVSFFCDMCLRHYTWSVLWLLFSVLYNQTLMTLGFGSVSSWWVFITCGTVQDGSNNVWSECSNVRNRFEPALDYTVTIRVCV